MDYRKPLQHLLRTLLPARHPLDAAAAQPEFEDTRPIADADATPPRRKARAGAADKTASASRRQPAGWAGSSIDLEQGTEIMEFPDDTAADLMDQYFAQPSKRAA